MTNLPNKKLFALKEKKEKIEVPIKRSNLDPDP